MIKKIISFSARKYHYINSLYKRYKHFIARNKDLQHFLNFYFNLNEQQIYRIYNANSVGENPKTYDCFIFDNEKELLDLRLNEYYESIDYFVIVEFSKTHTGFIKTESNFGKMKEVWGKFEDKIIYKYIDIDSIPNFSNYKPNNIENYNRDYIEIVLREKAKIGDHIFISDIDEFWNLKKLDLAKSSYGISLFMQNLYYHFINNKKNQLWIGTVKYNYGDFKPQEARDMAIIINAIIFSKSLTEIIDISNTVFSSYFKIIIDGGNHYSWFSNIKGILNKKNNIYESSIIKKNFIDQNSIINRINNGEDILGRRGWQFESYFVPATDLQSPPNKLEYFLEKYPEFAKPIGTEIIKKSVEIISLIYSSVEMLKIVYEEILKVKNANKDWDIGIKIVANDATPNVIEFLKQSEIPHIIYNNKNPKEYHLNRVYRAYNFAAFNSKYENVIFINSDMVFGKHWFENLVKHHNGVNIPNSRLVEYGNMNASSWSLLSDCGNGFNSMIDFEKFYAIENLIMEDKVNYGGLYMPCIMKTSRFVEAGGYPEGNVNKKGKVTTRKSKIFKTGDRWFFENVLQKKYGMNHVTVYDSICYHLQEGEKNAGKNSK